MSKVNTQAEPTTVLPQCIELVAGPACGALIEAPKGWPNVPHVEVDWRGARLYYAPEPIGRRTAIFVRQEGHMKVPDMDAAI